MNHNYNLCQPSLTWVSGFFAYMTIVKDRLADGVITGKDRVSGNHLIITP